MHTARLEFNNVYLLKDNRRNSRNCVFVPKASISIDLGQPKVISKVTSADPHIPTIPFPPPPREEKSLLLPLRLLVGRHLHLGRATLPLPIFQSCRMGWGNAFILDPPLPPLPSALKKEDGKKRGEGERKNTGEQRKHSFFLKKDQAFLIKVFGEVIQTNLKK